MNTNDDELARLARRDPEYSHIPDDTLDDWYRRWPSTLPTSVPHEQVRMLVENVRVARARIAELEAHLTALLTDQPLENGEYVHEVTCSASRAEPFGNDGCSCRMAVRLKKLEAKVRERDEAILVLVQRVRALIEAIRVWASDEDGIPEHAAPALAALQSNPLIGGAK